MEYELKLLNLEDGRCPFEQWYRNIRDGEARDRIRKRLLRIRDGNLGDCKQLGEGVFELRIDFGPGYRVYFAIAQRVLIVLINGGDKSTQNKDISAAKRFWRENKDDAERFQRDFRP